MASGSLPIFSVLESDGFDLSSDAQKRRTFFASIKQAF
jgi:hypothetical protein